MKFAAVIEYIQDKTKIQEIRPVHRQYLLSLKEKGQLAASGPFLDDYGALIVYEAPTKEEGGRVLFFEGTYTHSFSGNPDTTPRYEYNQMMYKLNLDDARLALPVAVYAVGSQEESSRFATIHGLHAKDDRREVAFFALDRPVKGMVPVYSNAGVLRIGEHSHSAQAAEADSLFYAFPIDGRDPPGTTTPLYEYTHRDGKSRLYSTDAALSRGGFLRGEKPLCRVWRNPRGERKAQE